MTVSELTIQDIPNQNNNTSFEKSYGGMGNKLGSFVLAGRLNPFLSASIDVPKESIIKFFDGLTKGTIDYFESTKPNQFVLSVIKTGVNEYTNSSSQVMLDAQEAISVMNKKDRSIDIDIEYCVEAMDSFNNIPIIPPKEIKSMKISSVQRKEKIILQPDADDFIYNSSEFDEL
ncbi:hypothetical protein NC661_06540 [Aquibacillus koreensis]|uniref:Uncharacterized protein n=1 Tax=Aquibacillus koreensis TaxID=279446 RepID=A0A9X4AHT0_9BACI|nr:hypothetical protein [Aquibacillus koreensis]MCT2535691.1 hypothetical protein [Aquibacillus koreensis]MDC3420024.1 hypothetical protein [Aquibacillus koreensis]